MFDRKGIFAAGGRSRKTKEANPVVALWFCLFEVKKAEVYYLFFSRRRI